MCGTQMPTAILVYLEHAGAARAHQLGSDIVDGYATPNSTAAVVLKSAGSVIASTQAPTDMDGAFSAFFLDGQGNVINLVAGDVVEVTASLTAAASDGKEVAASPTATTSAVGLTAIVDPTLDQITGSAPAGAAVLVSAYRCPSGSCLRYRATAITGADGSYRLALAGIFDLDQTSYAYAQVVDGEGNMTSFTSTPSAVPQLAAVESGLQAQGATLLARAAFGTANSGNLAPPMVVNAVGAGKLIFQATGGTLVVTAPDGTIMRSENGFLTVADPLSGKWLVQVLVEGPGSGNGTQYTVAAGQGLYTVYMPIVKLQTKK